MKLKIEWQYKTKSGATVLLTADYMPVGQALLFYEDMMKTGRVQSIELIDEYDSVWLLKEIKKYLAELETEVHEVSIYFDAGYEREEGISGLGIVIYYKQNGNSYRIRQNACVHHLTSNNEAEYAALHFAIKQLYELEVSAQVIEVYGDSQVVISQMRGDWPVYEQSLENWANKIDDDIQKLKLDVNYIHIPRQQNSEAHKIAAQALQGVDISSRLKL